MQYELVICGGGVVGLAAACALSKQFERIAIIDARHLGPDGLFRRTVAQANHVHHLLAGGQEWLEEMAPNVCTDLLGQGAQRLDYSGEIAVFVGDSQMPQRILGFSVMSMSRSLLDQILLERVNQIKNVQILDGQVVEGFSVNAQGVTHVHTRKRAQRLRIAGSIFLDCTGASNGHHWMAQARHPRRYHKCPVNFVYASFRAEKPCLRNIHPHARGLIINPSSKDSRFLAAMPIENNETMVTFGLTRRNSELLMANPRDEIHEILHAHKIPTELHLKQSVHRFGQQSIYWRRFKVEDELPLNYFPMGDFVSQLTPLSGQGITLGLSHLAAFKQALNRQYSDLDRQEVYLASIEHFTRLSWISVLSKQPKAVRLESGNAQFESEVEGMITLERGAAKDSLLQREFLARKHYLGAHIRADIMPSVQ